MAGKKNAAKAKEKPVENTVTEVKEKPEKVATEVQAEQKPESTPERKPAHQIRIPTSRIKNVKDRPDFRSTTLGLQDAEGNVKYGQLLIGAKAIVPDKHTATLPEHQQKSYINFVLEKEYPVRFEENGAKVDVKMKASDIIAQNKAYVKARNASRTAQLAETVEAAGPEVEQQAEV